MIGFAFCGSFCTLSHSLAALRQLCADGYDVLPIMSETTYGTDTRFWQAKEFRESVSALCKKEIVHTIVGAEPLGPRINLDALVISPCTGNTLAKIARGITDSSVTMATMAHLRADRTTLIALASDDAMSANLSNIAQLLLRKNVYFVPMRQDDPTGKPHSLVADFTQLPDCLKLACENHQRCPLFL